MQGMLRLAALAFLAMAVTGCPDRNPTRGECSSDADCQGELGFCFNDTCVECYRGEHCDCHEACEGNVCGLLGADSGNQTLNAHGNWAGAPGAPSYSPTGLCTDHDQCDFGELCNPFTGGCIIAADFIDHCGGNDTCNGSGPNGEVLSCDTLSDLCLPAALCIVDSNRLSDPAYDSSYNCCKSANDPRTANFVCDAAAGIGYCVPQRQDCTPPTDVTSTCPLEPHLTDECSPGLFCSLAGRCVQCTCDNDCDVASGLRCYAPTGRCVAADFCGSPEECQAGESCDLTDSVCRARCNNDTECDGGDFCRNESYVPPLTQDQVDNVCKPRALLPCLLDSFEPNQSATEALAGPVELPLPTVGQSLDVEGLTLCTDDQNDWFTMPLTRGDRLVIRGSSLDDLGADLNAFAADGLTELETGRISLAGGDLVDFTADFDDVYLFEVDADFGDAGTYKLNIERSTGTPCDDPFEVANGANNSAETASWLNGTSGVPTECTLTSGAGVSTIDCSGGVVGMCTGDVDFYLFDAPPNSNVMVEMSNFAGDLDLYLYGPFFAGDTPDTSRSADTSSSTSATETVEDFTRPPGTYLVRVRRYSGTTTNYDLVLTLTDGPTCTEDAYDTPTFNDVFVDASEVALTVPGTTSLTSLALCISDTDWYRIGIDNAGTLEDLPAGVRVRVTLTPTSIATGDDITLAMKSDETTVVGGSTSTFSPATLAFIESTNGGPYWIQILGNSGNSDTITYDLDIDYITPPVCDLDNLGDVSAGVRNDVPADAFVLDGAGGWPVALGETNEVTDVDLCGLDDDWYRIVVPAGASVIASINYDPLVAELGLAVFDDTVLTSTNIAQGVLPDTGLLASSEAEERGTQRVRGAPTGEAYIMVYNRTGWPQVNPGYDLRVQLVQAACFEDAYEENDVWDSATPIPLVTSATNPRLQTGLLDLATMCTGADGELDWYSVPVQAGDTIEANVYYDPNEGNLDLFMYRPGPDGVSSSIDYDWDDFAQIGVLHVEYSVSTTGVSGDYLLKVLPYDISASDIFENLYLIDVSVLRACINDAREPSDSTTPTAITPPIDEALALCGEEDWYVVSAPAAGAYTVCAGFNGADGNVDLLIYQGNQTSIVGGGAATTGNSEQATFTSDGSSDYFIRVFMPTPTNLDYNLKVGLSASTTCP